MIKQQQQQQQQKQQQRKPNKHKQNTHKQQTRTKCQEKPAKSQQKHLSTETSRL